jgi:hypothetical protein
MNGKMRLAFIDSDLLKELSFKAGLAEIFFCYLYNICVCDFLDGMVSTMKENMCSTATRQNQ